MIGYRMVPTGIGLAALGLFCAAALGADPTQNPNLQHDERLNAIRAHGKAFPAKDDAASGEPAAYSLENLMSVCQKLDAKLREDLIALEQASSQNRLEKAASRKEIADLFLNGERMRRAAQRLQAHAETAGLEFHLRNQELRARIDKIVEAYRKYLAKWKKDSYPVFEKEGAAQSKRLAGIAAKLNDKVFAAETEINEIWDTLQGNWGIWYEAGEWTKVMQAFERLRGEAEEKSYAAQRDIAARLLTEARDAERPVYAALEKSLTDAPGKLQTTGKAVWGEQMLDGPEWVLAVGEEWRRAHLAACRQRTWELARGVPLQQINGTVLAKIGDDDAAIGRRITEAIAEVIAADAARAQAVEARPLYMKYLAILPPLLALYDDEKFLVGCQASLDKLAAKAPDLLAEVSAYRLATSDVLRWRKRFADLRGKAEATNYPALETRLIPALSAAPPYPGMINPPGSTLKETRLRSPAIDVLKQIEKVIKNDRVTVAKVAPLLLPDKPGPATTFTARYAPCYYASLLHVQIPQEELIRLQQDLFVSPTSPPLSLEAAKALYTAHAGYMENVGGEISNIYLESLLTTFGRIKSWGCAIISLNPLVTETVQIRDNPLSFIAVRCQVAPAWVQHEYIFARVQAGK